MSVRRLGRRAISSMTCARRGVHRLDSVRRMHAHPNVCVNHLNSNSRIRSKVCILLGRIISGDVSRFGVKTKGHVRVRVRSGLQISIHSCKQNVPLKDLISTISVLGAKKGCSAGTFGGDINLGKIKTGTIGTLDDHFIT